MCRPNVVIAALLVLGLTPRSSYGQNPAPDPQTPKPGAPAPQSPTPQAPDSPDVTKKPVEAGDDEIPVPPAKTKKWNEWDGRISTLRFGYTLLVDLATYSQDNASLKQVGALGSDIGVRDTRILLSGRFKTKRPISWCFGYMYDGAADTWRVRQSGLDIGFPEVYGHVFLGRVKEGYSMIKLMNGTSPWGMERTEALDFIPILADGVKWMGYFPGPRIFYSLGWFGDALSEDQTFATFDHQFVARATWLPVFSEKKKELWHIGIMGRDGHPDNGKIQIRSRPEANFTPYFLDTGKFSANRARTAGFESYYRKGPLLIGGEYDWEKVDTPDGQHPTFRGGNVVATYLLTGETRGYNAPGSFFYAVKPNRPADGHGGMGAIEAVFNVSHVDYDSGNFHGGQMIRFTPMVNWYLSENWRLEFAYGYSILDKMDVKGHTHFFQMRIQTVL
jgi:phosphate-selective porin OprO/OprP